MLESYELCKKPFPHVISDSLFNEDEYQRVLEFFDHLDTGDHWLTAAHDLFEVFQDRAWSLFPLYKILLKDTHRPLNKRPVSEADSFFRIHAKKWNPGQHHGKLHRDSSWKQMSTVVYVGNCGVGTKIYSGPKELTPNKIIDWKPNRAMTFIPNQDSWHDFGHPADSTSHRLSLIFLLANKKYYK